MKKNDVSIIILSYNPVLSKLLNTIKSAIVQKDVDFEVIVADDGSKNSFEKEITSFFNKNNFYNYKLVFNKQNNGTVKNALSGLKVASGEYVYLVSQGDYIFDEFVISDFYQFAKQNKAKVCFGDYVNYSLSDDLNINTDILFPPIVSVYQKGFKYYKTSFFLGGNIMGASFLRERIFAIESFENISKYSKYTEDTTSTAYALMNNIRVYYFQRKIVWYESNTGIHSSSDDWQKRMKRDVHNTYRALLAQYPHDRVLDAGVMLTGDILADANVFSQNARIFIKHPIICIRKKMINRLPKRVITVSEKEIEYLKSIIS